jgi:F0F1-type ATP synthase delta subunit
MSALQANPQNEGKQFQLEFTVDPSIKGGLQMYTETEFMDMSLSSRLDRLKNEVEKLVN